MYARPEGDCVRHCIVTLLESLDYLQGTPIIIVTQQHLCLGWLPLLKKVEHVKFKKLKIQLIDDDYAMHKRCKIKLWLAKRDRCHIQFSATWSSWHAGQAILRQTDRLSYRKHHCERPVLGRRHHHVSRRMQPCSRALRLEAFERGDPARERKRAPCLRLTGC